jgi:hypothetical protein
MFVHSVCRGVDTFRQYGCVQSRVREVVTRVAAIVYTRSSVLSRQADMYCIEWVQHVQLHRVSQGVQMHDSCRCTDTE